MRLVGRLRGPNHRAPRYANSGRDYDSSAQRAIGDTMDRRHFVLGTAGTVLLGSGRIEAEADGEASVKVNAEHPGIAIAADFVGLSYEAAVLASSEYFNPDNRSVLGLMRELGSNGVLRIGGNTSERTVWQFSQAGDQTNTYIIKPEAIDALAAFLRALGWRLIYGLNLARGTPDEAAEEAAYVARAVGSRLLALQISNEPDGFGRWSAVRPPSYDAAAFVREWLTFYDALRTRVPNAAFAGPDVAAETGWVPIFAEAVPGGLVMITRHYYSDGPAGSPKISLTKLLRSAPQLEAVLSELRRYGHRYQLPFRIAETNSVFDNGRPGVSDTLGSALWGIQTMFQVASAGGVGINFHAGDDKVYTPIGPGRGGPPSGKVSLLGDVDVRHDGPRRCPGAGDVGCRGCQLGRVCGKGQQRNVARVPHQQGRPGGARADRSRPKLWKGFGIANGGTRPRGYRWDYAWKRHRQRFRCLVGKILGGRRAPRPRVYHSHAGNECGHHLDRHRMRKRLARPETVATANRDFASICYFLRVSSGRL